MISIIYQNMLREEIEGLIAERRRLERGHDTATNDNVREYAQRKLEETDEKIHKLMELSLGYRPQGETVKEYLGDVFDVNGNFDEEKANWVAIKQKIDNV